MSTGCLSTNTAFLPKEVFIDKHFWDGFISPNQKLLFIDKHLFVYGMGGNPYMLNVSASYICP